MDEPIATLERDTPTEAAHAARHRSGPIKAGRLAGLTMSRAIWVLAWPILIESVLNSTVGLVDTMLASGISKAAADGVAAAAYMLWFVGLITTAIGVGATALISRSLGAGHKAVANAALGQAMVLAACAGVVVGAAMAAAAPTLAGLFSLGPVATGDFVKYMRAISIGVPFSTVMFAGIACARGAGDTLRPLWAMVIVNVVNLVVAWLLAGHDFATTSLVNGEAVRTVWLRHPMPEWMHLDALGIGLGTMCAHITGAAVIVLFHLRGRSGIVLKKLWMRFHAVTVKRLVRLGLPNFFEMLGMWAGNMLVVLMVSLLNASHARDAAAVLAATSGTDGEGGGLLGAHLIAIRIEAFSFLPGFSMGIAAGALAGQYLGAGAPLMARRAALRCAGIAAAIMGLMGLGFIFAGKAMAGVVSGQAEHLELAPKLLMITGCVQVPFALAIVLRSAMHGAGDVRAVMVMTWISTWGLRLPLAYAMSGVDIPLPHWLGGGALLNPFPFQLGLAGLWIGLCIEIVLRCAIYSVRFIQGGWMKARV